jgi:hypothetical protein
MLKTNPKGEHYISVSIPVKGRTVYYEIQTLVTSEFRHTLCSLNVK